jgi:hypothetical protein
MVLRAVARGSRAAAVLLAVVGGLGGLAGCGPEEQASPVRIANAYLGPLTVAVAPALNFSGSIAFDPDAVADIMATELDAVVGIEVIPVSRVLAVLGEEGRDGVASPAHARSVVERLGADAILVFAVTEYEPYHPPVVGIAAQLYGVRRVGEAGGLDPVRLSREARPSSFEPGPETFGPLAQSERVYDASHRFVAEDIQEFAEQRDAGDSPFGWQLYTESQRHFLQYCCERTLRSMFGGGVDLALAGGR